MAERHVAAEETESLVKPLLDEFEVPSEKQEQYYQRLIYGLKQYYQRHYASASSENDESSS